MKLSVFAVTRDKASCNEPINPNELVNHNDGLFIHNILQSHRNDDRILYQTYSKEFQYCEP
uniref:Uncharacterized protein n=1 Tax=Onchocerca volvulus TaxID=6282 RepID=A0A8R1XX15_ONCVO